MKRRTVKAILCAALMALTLSMTACGGSDDASKGADAAAEEEAAPETEAPEEEAAPETEAPEEEAAPANEEAEAPEEEAAPEEGAESAGGETLEDYLNSTPGAMEAIEAEIAGAGDESMTVEAEVKGNDFTFNFTIVDASMITDDVSEKLETGLDATASIFEEMAGQMDEEMGQEGTVTIVIRYLDPDGNVLAERNFKAQ